MPDCLICGYGIDTNMQRLTVEARLGTEFCQVQVCDSCIARLKRMPALEFTLFSRLSDVARNSDIGGK